LGFFSSIDPSQAYNHEEGKNEQQTIKFFQNKPPPVKKIFFFSTLKLSLFKIFSKFLSMPKTDFSLDRE
jgi:hypothetical protein